MAAQRSIVPTSMALLPTRWQMSRARSDVIRSVAACPHHVQSFVDLLLGHNAQKSGDRSSCTASACLSASSKTASPVLLTKSARTIVSFSVSACAFVERQQNSPAVTAARMAAAGMRNLQSRAMGLLACVDGAAEGAPSLTRRNL